MLKIYNNQGFTLVELIIVVAIISLLAAGTFVAINPGKRIGESQDAQRWADLSAISKAVDNYTADHGELPSDLNIATINTGDKVVLCSSSQSLTCDGQTNDCLVVDDTSFLGAYLPQLPVDPQKTDTTDTGYYITRTAGDLIAFGACDCYDTDNIPQTQCGSTMLAYTASWSCGDDVAFTYNSSSVTYGSVENPSTGECWLDRNLGATQVATAYNDSNAYGHLFQWGRLDDGHQVRTFDSFNICTTSSSDDPGHSDFICVTDAPYDWRSPQNDNLWQGVSGTNNPCPSGWRIPTEAEWTAERATWSSSGAPGAFGSPLKLTVGGSKNYSDIMVGFYNIGYAGYYWSSSVDDTDSHYLIFNNGGGEGVFSHDRAYGNSVRCIKD